MVKKNSKCTNNLPSSSANLRKDGEFASSERQRYYQPEVYSLGSLEQIQLGSSGSNYDSSSRWWYYE